MVRTHRNVACRPIADISGSGLLVTPFHRPQIPEEAANRLRKRQSAALRRRYAAARLPGSKNPLVKMRRGGSRAARFATLNGKKKAAR
jgi:hypothetical protein